MSEVKTQTVLTKVEAIQAMREGKKVQHYYFSPEEWMSLTPSGLYLFEDGSVCPSLVFWEWRKDEYWETGWLIYNDKIN